MEHLVPVPQHLIDAGPLRVPRKRMMGPGPSNASARVLAAMAEPILGHMHAETFRLMDECKAAAQYAFQTRNALTFCLSASGHGAMDAAMGNLLEPGDVALMLCTGLWGERAGHMAGRYGADVRFERAAAAGGASIALDAIERRLRADRPAVVFVTQGDSSTGVLQPIDGIGELCRRYDAILVVDTVASLGGTTFYADDWLCDCVYTGTQKVLGAPPGLSPITFNGRAIAKIRARKRPVPSYYFDVLLVGEYWGCFEGMPRIYHHTIAPTLLYGVREAFAEFCAEGVQACVFRHRACAGQLYAGLAELGLELFVGRRVDRLPTVTTVKVPPGVDWLKVVAYVMEK